MILTEHGSNLNETVRPWAKTIERRVIDLREQIESLLQKNASKRDKDVSLKSPLSASSMQKNEIKREGLKC